MKLLPVVAIYGGNASSKTNFFIALNFVRHLIVAGTMPGSLIPTERRTLTFLVGHLFR